MRGLEFLLFFAHYSGSVVKSSQADRFSTTSFLIADQSTDYSTRCHSLMFSYPDAKLLEVKLLLGSNFVGFFPPNWPLHKSSGV